MQVRVIVAFVSCVASLEAFALWRSTFVVLQQVSDNSVVGLKDFELVKVIGRGSYAKVFVVTQRRTQRIYKRPIDPERKQWAREYEATLLRRQAERDMKAGSVAMM